MELDQILLELRLHGWCVLEEIIPDNEVAAVRGSIEKTAARQMGKTRETNAESVAVRNCLNIDGSIVPYLADERLLAPMRAVFGPYIRMRSVKGFVEFPGVERGATHADGPFIQSQQSQPLCVEAPYQDATLQFTTVWMLSDFTAENGGTIVIPGSHRASTNRTAGLELPIPHSSEVTVKGSAGSVLLFDNRLWHSGGSNHSDAPRVGMINVYFPWWLCQDQNMPPGTDTRDRLREETGLTDEELGPGMELISRDVFDAAPADVKPLLRHWVRP